MSFCKIFSLWRKRNKLQKLIPKPMDCRVEKMTIPQAEAYFLESYERFKNSDIYEHLMKEHQRWILHYWKPFILQFREDDELWFFNTPDIFWTNMMGRNGFIIVRDNKQISKIVFMQS